MFRRLNTAISPPLKSVKRRRPRLFLEQLERRDLLAVTINSLVVPSTGQKGDLIALSADASSDQPVRDADLRLELRRRRHGQRRRPHRRDARLQPALRPRLALRSQPHGFGRDLQPGDRGQPDRDRRRAADCWTSAPPKPFTPVSSVTFNAVVADPAGPSDVASIQWDFNYDGSTFNADVSANGQTTPSYTYATPGTYIVEVQATDLSGNSTIGATAVVVKPPNALIVQAGPDQTVSASPGMMAMQARRCRSTAATATPAARCRRAASLGTSTTAARTRCSAAVRGPCPAAVRASRPRPPAR